MPFKYTQDYEHPWHIARYDLDTATFQRFDYQAGSWAEDHDLTKILVGDYWEFDEITADEAQAFISRFAEERPWEHLSQR